MPLVKLTGTFIVCDAVERFVTAAIPEIEPSPEIVTAAEPTGNMMDDGANVPPAARVSGADASPHAIYAG
jgi:hypothetical protein